MTHEEKIARWIGTGTIGTEIGAGSSPVPGLDPAPIYVDCYKEFGAMACLADYYGHACALPFRDNSLDYVIASHVLEHVANPVAALEEWYRVLRPGGIIYVLVPDRRVTWDRNRPLTSVEHMLEDFARGTTAADATHVDDFANNVVWSEWCPSIAAADVPAKKIEIAEILRQMAARGEEINIHFHTFEPSNLRNLLETLTTWPTRPFDWEIVDFADPFPANNPNGILAILRAHKHGHARPGVEISRDRNAVLRPDAQPFAEWTAKAQAAKNRPPLAWKIEECSAYFGRLHLIGWCFDPASPVTRVEAVFSQPPIVVPLLSYGRPSPDVATHVNPTATHCRFDEWLDVPPDAIGRDFSLRLTLADGSIAIGASVQLCMTDGDPFHASWRRFLELLQQFPAGQVLEIGSRARSAITRRHALPSHLGYVGLDILAGPNVDILGDAHELEKLFGRDRFVAAISFSVFEHLAMPWKVAIELNRALVPGGIVFTQTHQTWPVHDEPWDFWRFSRHSWQTFFNEATGFEVIEANCGDPAHIHAHRATPVTRDLPACPAYLGSSSIVRKISETSLSWPVSTATAARGSYPAGELTQPPS